MLFKSKGYIHGIIVGVFLLLAALANLYAADTTMPVISHIDEILKANPIEVGKPVRLITIAESQAVTVYVVRSVEGYFLKPHIHKTHDESVYVIRGKGQMLINDKWVDIQPGDIHFNPMGKVHSIKHAGGSEELVVLSVFTPAMKETDRHFVP